jgi:hypothetical protein
MIEVYDETDGKMINLRRQHAPIAIMSMSRSEYHRGTSHNR